MGLIITEDNEDFSNGSLTEEEGIDETMEAVAQAMENQSGIQYASKGMKCTVRDLYQSKPDKHGRTSWTTDYPDDLEEPAENLESAQYALVIRHQKCYDGRKQLQIQSIVVQSPLLKKVLGKVLQNYPGVTTSLDRLEFTAPFTPFVHRWEALGEARAKESDPETKEHVELLWEVLEKELRDTISEKQDLLAHGVVTYKACWTIFEPGALIYHNDDGVDRAYFLQNGDYVCGNCPAYVLNVQSIDFDGEQFGHVTSSLRIPAFAGTTQITRLSAFPLAFHPEPELVKKNMVSRGQLFEAYKGYHFKAYEGIAFGYGPWGIVRYTVNSRIIIDTYGWNRFNPNQRVRVSRIKPAGTDISILHSSDDEYDSEEDDDSGRATPSQTPPSDIQTTDLSEKQLMICTDRLHGYSLKDKKWMMFPLREVKEIVWNKRAFDSLVAPVEQKELILAFAQSQAKSKDTFDDVIQGKGKGIIMLLSGPPGVGKTLTAESVAEVMKVPLYTMSAGDLGTMPSGVEAALSNILEMSTKWNAILLLDEADVFLEARSTHDLERNKLVSIFLRLLEYYEGILFLTTNRVDNLDAAFESRIHLSLEYDDLDVSSRRHVWTSFLSRSSNVAEFSAEQLDSLAEKQLNGRQIKNILKTAQLLATKKEAALDFGYVDTVLRLREANSKKKSYALDA
ncbi:uncharacterized protein K452DRAFT_243751 [Aplosporella prunicola CBS 121167]|uniref:AAA+ ATPase domain-containing protein n=1 Tax=Aplosporella prunicola CBS 121167 TaxID=1176127 RepID=A0A6A6BN71_9PEZI|nr:uncharacterized protein K452DRAFT_243751 [Aplosporella prunicola CBS 121167]KAF2145589.1 hypothetical protein K452DRAFT_243751 [Aplosporella prunicola CBS 121167]